jgi:maintenance of mitochondrial morphology protein 1
MIAQFRDDARVNNAIVQSLDEILNSERKPGFIGEIKITELVMGEEFPRFSNCRILPLPGDSNRLVSAPFDKRGELMVASGDGRRFN